MGDAAPVSGARAASLWLGAVLALAVAAAQVVPVLAPALAASHGLPPGFIGLWNGGLWAAALLGTLAAPALLARFDGWALAQACLLLCAAGTAAVASGHALALLPALLCIGLAQGLEGPVASHVLAARVSAAGRPLWFSVKQSGVQVGAMSASALLPAAALAWGWQGAALATAAFTAALAIALRRPRRRLAVPQGSRASASMRGLARALRGRPSLRALALSAACFGAVQVVLNGFFVSYAVAERGVSLVQAGAWLALAQAGGLVGRPLWGWVATRTGRSAPVLLLLGVAMALCTATLGVAGPSALLLVLFGLSASGWNGLFLAEVARRSPAAEVGQTTAAVLVVMTLGLVIGPLIFGALGAATRFGTAYLAWAGVALAGCAAVLRAATAADPPSTR